VHEGGGPSERGTQFVDRQYPWPRNSFSDPKLDALIEATQHSDSPAAMRAYTEYGSITLPAIWQPNYDYQLTEIANNLKGVTPQNPYLNITPEDWYYVK